MPKHDHPAVPEPKPCEHKLRFCKQCDAVECEACGKEWVRPCTLPNARSPLQPNPFRGGYPDRVFCSNPPSPDSQCGVGHAC